jgi:hypothetical protein
MTLQRVAILAQRRERGCKIYWSGMYAACCPKQQADTSITENSWLCPAQVPAPLPANRSAEEATDELHRSASSQHQESSPATTLLLAYEMDAVYLGMFLRIKSL